VSRGATLVLLLAAAGAAGGETAHPERLRRVDRAALGYTYGVGSFEPEYVPPAPGSYTLPVVQTVQDHPLLDPDGRPTTLFHATDGHLAVVAFVYTTCVDVAGCPLANAVMKRVDRALADDPALAADVRLVTVSFDPERDTPAHMAELRALYEPRTTWRFLTPESPDTLRPLLDDFGQPVAKLRYADGEWSGLYRHVLKVFLLDRENRVRNVYSAGFLNPALVLNDLRTLRGDH
jgi:cytochrome c peroxidase